MIFGKKFRTKAVEVERVGLPGNAYEGGRDTAGNDFQHSAIGVDEGERVYLGLAQGDELAGRAGGEEEVSFGVHELEQEYAFVLLVQMPEHTLADASEIDLKGEVAGIAGGVGDTNGNLA
ncbi:hypothetical protein HMPREF1981_03170 [Bacteroides pyogenes F0041]|uniref:Uncharacterized protein n=1 Tax=Bacteroides pyogenes F0041 TaxID=1321819 RepID=U2DNX8_9BACE|nr:hypothetical protein HMPREF1981_03170 [Bacteroides pyogenes F0041]